MKDVIDFVEGLLIIYCSICVIKWCVQDWLADRRRRRAARVR